MVRVWLLVLFFVIYFLYVDLKWPTKKKRNIYKTRQCANTVGFRLHFCFFSTIFLFRCFLLNIFGTDHKIHCVTPFYIILYLYSHTNDSIFKSNDRMIAAFFSLLAFFLFWCSELRSLLFFVFGATCEY